jgi:hypothetical protein
MVLIVVLMLLARLALVPIGVGAVSSPSSRSPYLSHRVITEDLSFQFHLEKDIIIDRVGLKLLQNDQMDEYNLDVSNSKLEDDGMSKLLQCIQNITACRMSSMSSSNAYSAKIIRLEARMNQITTAGLVHIIQELLLSSGSLQANCTANAATLEVLLPESEQQIVGNNSFTPTNNSTIEATNDDDKDSIILSDLTLMSDSDNITSKTSATHLPPNFYIQLLDLGWNFIGGTDHYEGSRHPHISNRKLYKSIRELIQSSHSCPETLHLEQCGISVGFCRAIGKVQLQQLYSQTTLLVSVITPLCLSLSFVISRD